MLFVERHKIKLRQTYLFIGFRCARACPSCGVLSLYKKGSTIASVRKVKAEILTVPPKHKIDMSKAIAVSFQGTYT